MTAASKDKYREVCRREATIPLFSRAWWLDAVCGDEWDVCLIEKNGEVVASLPFHVRKRWGLTLLTSPPETPALGPWLRASTAKYSNRLAWEKELMTELIAQLPRYHLFQQNWHHSISNWLPFYWQGFRQTTLYTYRLPDLSNIDAIWGGLRENIRRDIRKARDRYKLEVRSDLSFDDYLALNQMTYSRQSMRPPHTEAFMRRLDRACLDNKARQILIAVDEHGQHHAGVYVVWDENSAYYLMGGADPKLRGSGATSLCMWEAIKLASTLTQSFDFEGSMLEPIERFFRAFGAVQTPYFSISKVPSRLLRIRSGLRDIL